MRNLKQELIRLIHKLESIMRIFFKLLNQEVIDYLHYKKFSLRLRKLKNLNKKQLAKKLAIYENDLSFIPTLIKTNSPVFIDIGANYGLYTLFFSRIAGPKGKVFSFEPVFSSYKILLKMTKEFGLKNTCLIKLGLGAKKETKNIIIPSERAGNAFIEPRKHIKNSKDRIETIKIETLDNFVKSKKITKIDFIKCDVEGFELEVFKGAKQTLKKFKPIILCEIEEKYFKEYNIFAAEELFKFFKSLNYQGYYLNKNKLIKTNSLKTDFIVKEVDSVNYFFIAK